MLTILIIGYHWKVDSSFFSWALTNGDNHSIILLVLKIQTTFFFTGIFTLILNLPVYFFFLFNFFQAKKIFFFFEILFSVNLNIF